MQLKGTQPFFILCSRKHNSLCTRLHCVFQAITHKDAVTAICFDPKTRCVATTSVDSTVCVWDFDTGTPVFEFIEAHGKEAIVAAKFGHTNKRLITAGDDGRLKVQQTGSPKCACSYSADLVGRLTTTTCVMHSNSLRFETCACV